MAEEGRKNICDYIRIKRDDKGEDIWFFMGSRRKNFTKETFQDKKGIESLSKIDGKKV